ncbi:MAG: fibrobacter succinogenes major paralogous domain-containing protein [Fibrobacter sp.]|nr:fibrobacter succinogenes major paralogous domain-containing protein [Fibrobacter sp.]
MRKILSLAFVSAVAAGLFACGGDSSSSGPDGKEEVVESSSETEVESSSSEEPESSNTEEPESSSEEDDSSDSEPESSDSGISSSSSQQSSFSAGEDKSVYDASKNTLTDLRDGQTYRTTTISIPAKDYSEVWMAENLNYEVDNSYCYDDEQDNCERFGRLYTWAAAVCKTEEECGYGQDCGLPSGNIRGICPQGWHLPSLSEWETLIVAVDGSITEYTRDNTAGKKLKSTNGWSSSGGADAYSFSALPAGFRYNDGSYYGVCDFAYFWSSTEGSSYYASYYMNLFYDLGKANLNYDGKYNGYSVRCLKD